MKAVHKVSEVGTRETKALIGSNLNGGKKMQPSKGCKNYRHIENDLMYIHIIYQNNKRLVK